MGQRASYDSGDQNVEWVKFLDRMLNMLKNPASSAAVMSELSAKFFGLMAGAMLVSFHKYGAVADGFPERIDAIGAGGFTDKLTAEQKEQLRTAFNLLGSLGKRLNWYFFGDPNPEFGKPGEEEYFIKPGNTEYLVDCANYFAIEFMHPALPAARYEATDRWGSPGRRARNTEVYGEQGNQFANREVVAAGETVSF